MGKSLRRRVEGGSAAMVKEGKSLRRRVEGGSAVDLYLYGIADGEAVMHQVKFETKKKKRDLIFAGSPLIFEQDGSQIAEGWTVCGEHIYWTGASGMWDTVLPDLFKHRISEEHSKNWEIEESVNRRPRPLLSPFVAADFANQKLYVVGGSDWPVAGDDWASFCKPEHCGEVYDIRTRTWKPLTGTPFSEVREYSTRSNVSVVVKDNADEPMEIVFYDLFHGSILFLNVTAGGVSCPVVDKDALRHFANPRGVLKMGYRAFMGLVDVTKNTRAVVTRDTFYWFNFDMRLYAFDLKAKTWLKSQSLLDLLPQPTWARFPVLVGLPNRKMLLIIPYSPRELTVASLQVKKKTKKTRKEITKRFLHVSVESTQAYYVGDPDQTFSFFSADARLHGL